MKFLNRFLFLPAVLFCGNMLQAQTNTDIIKNALIIAQQNSIKLESSEQLLVVYNSQPESYSAFFIALEKKDSKWVVKYDPTVVGIGKNGFATPRNKREGDGKTPTGIYRLGKLYSYEKQVRTLLENQQTTADDKWIDDPDSEQYNTYVKGVTKAKSYENLLLNNDAYKYCMVIEYNTNPIVKGKGSAIFLHLAVNKSSFTAGCVAINEDDMKRIVNWLDPKRKPAIIMGDLNVLKSGLY